MKSAVLTLACGLAVAGLPARADDVNSASDALAALKAFGAVVTADRGQPGAPVIRLIIPPNSPKKLSDPDLALLKWLPKLRALDLGTQPLTDAGLKHLAALADLQELN